MGMSKDEFFKTYFTGQKELAAMAAMASTERGRFPLEGPRLREASLGAGSRRRAEDEPQRRDFRAFAKRCRIQQQFARATADATQRVTDATSAHQRRQHRNKNVQDTLAMMVPKWARAQHDRERAQALLAEINAMSGKKPRCGGSRKG
jgi:exonuclease SbcC